MARNNVTPTVADHVASGGLDPPAPHRLTDQAGLRLTARTAFVLPVRADHDSIDLCLDSKSLMHRFERFPASETVTDIRLICHHDDQEPGRLEFRNRTDGARQKAKVGKL